MSPRCWHRSFLTLCSLTERTVNNYSRTRQHWENPRMWGWSWSTPGTSDITTDWIRRWEKLLHANGTAPPADRHRVMQKGPPGLSFLQWEREHSRGQPAPPSIVHHFAGAPTLISPHRTAEESVGLSLWESVMEKQGRACNNQHMDLSRPSSYLQRPNSNPNWRVCSSAEPSWRPTLSRDLGRYKFCLVWIYKVEFCWPWIPDCHTQAQCRETGHMLRRVPSSPDCKAADNFCELYRAAVLKLRGGQAAL